MLSRTSKPYVAILSSALALHAFTQPAYAFGLQLEQELGLGLEPAIAADAASVYVAWRSLDGAVCHPTYCANDVFLRHSTDGGTTFAPVVNVSADVDQSRDPAVAASGASVYVAWTSDSTTSDVVLRASADGGATFSATVNVSGTGQAQYARVAAMGTNVYVIWYDHSLANYEVFFRRSVDGGATFDPILDLSSSATDGSVPSLYLDGGVLYVSWGEAGQLRVRRSDDDGATFSPASVLAAPANARLAFSGGNVYAAWMQQVDRAKNTPSNLEILFARSGDGGASFGPAVNLSNTATESRYPHIRESAGNVYVAWQDDASTKRRIDRDAELFGRRSGDGGGTFEATAQATDAAYYFIDNLSQLGSFGIAAIGSTLYITWFERVPNTASSFKVYFSRSP